MWIAERLEPAKMESWQRSLSAPLPGRELDAPDERQREAEGQAFMAFMGAHRALAAGGDEQ